MCGMRTADVPAALAGSYREQVLTLCTVLSYSPNIVPFSPPPLSPPLSSSSPPLPIHTMLTGRHSVPWGESSNVMPTRMRSSLN